MRTIPGTKIENLNSKVEAARIDCTAGTSKFESFGPQKILWFQTWAKFRVNSSTVYVSGTAVYSNTASTLDQNILDKQNWGVQTRLLWSSWGVQDRSCMEQGTQYRSSTDPSSKWHRFRLIRWIRPRDFAVDLSMPKTVDYALWLPLTNIFVLRVDESGRKLPGRGAE